MPNRPKSKNSRLPEGWALSPMQNPGDALRALAIAFEKDPDDPHYVDFGDGPVRVIPSQVPGIVEDLRLKAYELDRELTAS